MARAALGAGCAPARVSVTQCRVSARAGDPAQLPSPGGDRFAFCARFVLELLLHGVQLTLY